MFTCRVVLLLDFQIKLKRGIKLIELDNTDQLIINQLIDQELFTAIPDHKTTKIQRRAVHAFQNGYKQRRVANFFQTLIGTTPLNFGNNLVLMIGSGDLSDKEKHVLVATLKVIISSPQIDGLESDMVIDSPTVIHQVQSEVTELDEAAIYEIIDRLFVKRFGLLTPDYPEGTTVTQTEIMDPFWDIDPNFVSITYEFIQYLTQHSEPAPLTVTQRLNRLLLQQRCITAKQSAKQWHQLIENKDELSKAWQPLARFRLEIGDDYAVLLDGHQQKRSTRPLMIALTLVNKMGPVLEKASFTKTVRQITKTVSTDWSVNASDVRRSLIENALVVDKGDYFERTAVVNRFAIGEPEQDDQFD